MLINAASGDKSVVAKVSPLTSISDDSENDFPTASDSQDTAQEMEQPSSVEGGFLPPSDQQEVKSSEKLKDGETEAPEDIAKQVIGISLMCCVKHLHSVRVIQY